MGRTIRVRSRDAAFQRLETIKRNRVKRGRAGVCFVEGVLPLSAAARSGLPFEAICVAEGATLSSWAAEMVGSARASGADLLQLDPELLLELSDREDGVEVAALVQIPAAGLSDLAAGPETLLLVLDRPSSPGNLGTVVRSAAAFGVSAVAIAGHAADPFDPKAIAASRGAVFTVPLVAIGGAADLLGWRDVGEVRLPIAGASAGEADVRDLDEAALGVPLIVVMGNEAAGLSRGFAEACDLLVRIPMPGAGVDSLNVGVAAGIVLYEVRRRRP